MGKVGRVAAPWPVDGKDPKTREAARMLRAWQDESRRVFSLEDLTPTKKQKIEDALSPGIRDGLNALLRVASLAGTEGYH